jgi:outer membrane protein TolC
MSGGLQAAPDSAALRLEDVVQASLTDSPQVEQANDDVQRAQGDLRQARGAFDWKTSATAGATRLYFPNSVNGFLTDSLESSVAMHETAGVGRLLRNGMEGQVGVSVFENSGASSAQTMGATRPRPQLSVRVPFLRGSGKDSPAAATERAAQETVEGAQLQKGFAAQRAVHDAVQTYWRCLAAQEDVGVARADEKAADDYLATISSQAKAGLLEPTQVNRALAHQGVQRAEMARFEQTDAVCRNDLAVQMGASADSEGLPLSDDFPDPVNLAAAVGELNEAQLTALAFNHRPDVLALQRYASAETDRVHGAQNGTRPNVGFAVDTDSVYLSFSRNLGSDTEAGGLAKARASEDEAILKLRQLQAQIRRDLFQQLRGLRSSLTNCQALLQSVTLLQQVVGEGAERARAGRTTWQDYRDTEHDFATVEHELIAEKLQFASDLAALRLSTGTINLNGKFSAAALAALFRGLPEVSAASEPAPARSR